MRDNAVDVAVVIVIGAALGTIVTIVKFLAGHAPGLWRPRRFRALR